MLVGMIGQGRPRSVAFCAGATKPPAICFSQPLAASCGNGSEMVATGVRNSARIFARSGRALARQWLKLLSLGLMLVLFAPNISSGGVLTDSDLKNVEDIKPLFQNLMVDLVQTSKRTDISSGDADCIKSTIHELLQISEELSSYEYLITIQKDMSDVGDNNSLQDVIKFAVEKSNTILDSERKRLAQLSDQCTRFPLSAGKTRQALQFIDTTTGILKAIQVRL
jgi:hypothetical protein